MDSTLGQLIRSTYPKLVFLSCCFYLQLDTSCGTAGISVTEHHHGLDITTTLRSELAALSYKKERLTGEVTTMIHQNIMYNIYTSPKAR